MNNQNGLDEELRRFANTIIRCLKPIVDSGYSSATLEKTEKLAKIEHQKTLHAINKTIMEDLLAMVGEDEEPDTQGNVAVMAIYNSRNQLRQQIRRQLKERYGAAK